MTRGWGREKGRSYQIISHAIIYLLLQTPLNTLLHHIYCNIAIHIILYLIQSAISAVLEICDSAMRGLKINRQARSIRQC